jgi:threonine synthase
MPATSTRAASPRSITERASKEETNAAPIDLRSLTAAGVIKKNETAVCILTGNLLKDTDAVKEYHLDNIWNGAYRNPGRTMALNAD